MSVIAADAFFGDIGAVTEASNAATDNHRVLKITSATSITTAAGALYTVTLTNSQVTANSVVLATVCYGTSTTGTPAVAFVTPAAGSVVIKVQNIHASAAFNGSIVISVLIL